MFISASGFSGGAATTPSILRFLQPQQQQGQGLGQNQGLAPGGDSLQEGDWDTEEHDDEEGEEEGDVIAAAAATAPHAAELGVEAGASATASAVAAAPPVRYQRLSREEIDEEVLAELPEEMRRVRGGEG